jgi:hypothetical protein
MHCTFQDTCASCRQVKKARLWQPSRCQPAATCCRCRFCCRSAAYSFHCCSAEKRCLLRSLAIAPVAVPLGIPASILVSISQCPCANGQAEEPPPVLQNAEGSTARRAQGGPPDALGVTCMLAPGCHGCCEAHPVLPLAAAYNRLCPAVNTSFAQSSRWHDNFLQQAVCLSAWRQQHKGPRRQGST